MPVRIWGKTDSGLVVVEARPSGMGLEVIGLPPRRTRTTRDRLWSALLNSGVCSGRPAARLEVKPPIRAGDASGLDLALALAALGPSGVHLGARPEPTLAIGRLRLDGSVANVHGPVGDIPRGFQRVIVAEGSQVEVADQDHEVDVSFASDLREALRALVSTPAPPPARRHEAVPTPDIDSGARRSPDTAPAPRSLQDGRMR